MEWQPIDTAPKDGKMILCYWGNGFEPFDEKDYAICVWAGNDEWIDHTSLELYTTPKYWMPLPPPPEPK